MYGFLGFPFRSRYFRSDPILYPIPYILILYLLIFLSAPKDRRLSSSSSSFIDTP